MFRDPYVPTPWAEIAGMLSRADIAPGCRVLDVGSGDGRLVIASAALGADATGIELDAELVRKSRALIAVRHPALLSRTTIIEGDYMAASWRDYDVILLHIADAADMTQKFDAECRRTARLVRRVAAHVFAVQTHA